jgi:dipeptidyl aminopeptidase/acylaminoacyl peptidase
MSAPVSGVHEELRMKLRVACLSLLLIATATALAQDAAKRPITHEDVWLMKRVGTPALSPDGRLVVVPVAEPAYDEAARSSDLWLVAADGSAAPRRLTFSTAAESSPAWSPDSRRIAFAAKREGQEESQIYVLDIAAGGEAERVTNVATGASRPQWRPDGQAILFSSMVYPGAQDDDGNRARIAERKARKYNARAYDSFPIRHWDRWLDERRPTLMLQPLATDAPAQDLLAATALARGHGFGGNLGNEGESIPAAWSPDGSTIVFAATANRNQAAFADVIQSLFAVPAGGGEPRQLTGPEANYSDPQFAPDGSALYARSTPKTRFVKKAAIADAYEQWENWQ